jgi:DNA polymerase-3 subunit beta
MKITVETEKFAPRLALAARVSSNRTTTQILGGILIEAAEGGFTLSATDMDTSAVVPVGAEITEPGRAVVPARLLNDVVKGLPGDEKLTMEHEGGNGEVTLTAGKRNYCVHCYGTEDFPKLPTFEEEKALKLPKEAFAFCVGKAARTASRDESRPVLTGVLVEASERILRVVATDSYRLSIAEANAQLGPDAAGQKALIPAAALKEVVRVLSGATDVALHLQLGENHAAFKVADTVISSRLIDGNFPEYARLLPDSFAGEISLERAEMAAALSRVSIFAGRSSPSAPVTISYEVGTLGYSLRIAAESSELGAAREGIAVKVNEPLKPALISTGGGEAGEENGTRLTVLLMPMRDPKA